MGLVARGWHCRWASKHWHAHNSMPLFEVDWPYFRYQVRYNLYLSLCLSLLGFSLIVLSLMHSMPITNGIRNGALLSVATQTATIIYYYKETHVSSGGYKFVVQLISNRFALKRQIELYSKFDYACNAQLAVGENPRQWCAIEEALNLQP